MKQQLPPQSIINKKAVFLLLAFFFVNLASLFAQDITLDKVVTESTSCNEFDVSLTVTGNPPPIPQEVILVIDRSGSMDDGPFPEPIDHAKDAALSFVDNIFDPANNPTGLNKVAIVSYAVNATVDIVLTDSSGQTAIENAINAITPSGATNIARAMDTADAHMTAAGTFDCLTNRSIILLTDGVANRDINGNSCSSDPGCPGGVPNVTVCMQDAIDESVEAQTTNVAGTDYEQTVYSVGLFGALADGGCQELAAEYVLNGSQNGGSFFTEEGADLTGIYNDILNQLAVAAKMGVVTDVLGAGFAMVAGSLSDPLNASYDSGTNTITWDLGDVGQEIRTLDYSIEAVDSQSCGIQNAGTSSMEYEDTNCMIVTETFPNPQICVPCPDITDPVLDQMECTNVVDYSATFSPGDCNPFSIEFQWEFFLNNVSVGTASGTTMGDLSGTFTYTGVDPFEGDFRAELTYNGVYNNSCTLPPVVVQSEIQVSLPPDAPTPGPDQSECEDSPIQTLTATATVGLGETVVWYDSPTNGNVVPDPSLSAIGTVTYYAEASDDTTNCVSTSRVPVMLTIYDCKIEIEKTASPDDPNNCNPIPAGDDITYTFTVTNDGNVDITDVEVIDLLIDPNPLPGPASGDTNNNDILEFGEIWIYTATYTVLQADIINGQVDNTAVVSGTVTGSSDSFGVTDSDSETVILCQNAEISITKVSDGDTGNCNPYEVNDTVNYTFTVTNEGDVDISNVVVTDPNLGGVVAGPSSGDTSNIGVLDVGEIWIYNAAYSVTQADIDAGQITNTADVNGDTALGAVTDTSNTVVLTICQNLTNAIALIKVGTYDGFDVNGNCISAPGDEITYAFSVINQSNVTLTDVTVTDTGLTTLTGGPITLDPGQEDTTTFTGTYIITQADIDAGQYTNQALAEGTAPNGTVVSDDSDDNSYLEDDATVTTICQNITNAIALIKVGTYDGFDQAGNCISAPGDEITYAFSVINQSNVTLTDVTVTDTGLTTLTGGPITLDPGQEDTTTFTGTYIITQADIDAGQYTNQALAEGTAPNGTVVSDDSDDNSYLEDDATVTTICQNITNAIALIKVGTYDGFDQAGNCISTPGDEITYAFSVINQSNVTLTDVTVTDTGLTTLTGGPITLDPGQEDTTTFTGTYIITQADIDAGQYTNQALAEGTAPNGTVVSDDSDDNSYLEDDATVTTICQNITNAIALIKVGTYDGFDVNGNCISAPGDEITYAFSVINQSNVTLTDVTVTDTGLTTLTGGPITLDPGQEDTTTFTGTYIITQADIDAGQYTNQALAEGTAPNGTVVSDDSDDNSYLEDDATVTTICQNITNAIALIKVGTYDGFDVNGNCISAPGDEITYAFSVINQSNVTLTDVTVTDTGLTTLTGGPITLDPGQEDTTTFTGTYIITQADIDAGQYTNQALAEGTAPNGTVVSDDSDDNSYLEDDATVTTICQNITNAIALIKVGTYDGFDVNGNCISAPGDEITYAFSVINQSNVTLTDVTVTDTGLTTLTGGPITLDPGQEDTTTFTGTYIITQADIDAGQYTNQALAEGTAPNGTVVSDDSDDNSYLEDDATVTTICQNITNAIALIKVGTYDGFDQAGNCISAPGDEITYAFSVINQSNVTLTDVTVTDTGLTTLTGGPITLDPGQEDTTTFTGTYIITQADIDAGQYTNQALAEGTAPNGTVVSDDSDDNSYLEDDATVTTICQNITNAIALIKVGTYDGFDVNGNCISAPGDEITYAFSVINQSNVTLTDVTVTDTGLTTLTGGPITLDPGQEDTTTFTGTYIITQADIDAGQYTNQALAEGTAPNGTVVSDDSDDNSYLEDDATVTTICQNITNAIALIKVGTYDGFDQAGNCISAPGDEITYAFSVINQSNVTLTDVTVTDTGLTTLTGGPITLDPGQEDTTTFTGTYIITQADIDAGQYTNQALAEGTAPNGTVVSDDSDDNSYLEDDATVTTICQNITNAIALIKVGTYDGFDVNGNCISAPGDEITYAFSVINQSNVTLTDVTVTDTGLTTLTGGPITLDPGQEDTTTFTGTYIITQADIDAGQYTNQALAEGTAPNGTVVSDDSDDNSYLEDDATVTTICQNITNAIALIKVGTYDGFDQAGNCISAPGDEITYAFSVINQSNVTLTDVTVTDTGLTTLTGGPITLDPGQEDTTTFTGTYIITQADIDAGQYTNQALAEGTAPNGTVVSDDSDDNSYLEDDATVTTICQNITNAIALIKVGTYDGFDQAGNCISAPGDEITYAFSVINQSNVTLTDVTVTDTGLTTLTGGPITLDPGQEDTTTFTGTYIITQADIDAGQYTNQALAEGTAPNGTVVSDDSDDNSYLEDDATVTTICQNITNAIALIKVGTYDGFDVNGNCISAPGDEITYAFSVINQSNVTLTDVTVTDTGLTTLTGGPITLDPGQEDTTTFTGTYIITQADIDAGQYTNQALAEGTAPNGTVVSDDSDDNSYLEDDATVTTICQNITNAIALIKVGTYDGFDQAGNCISAPGDEITYAFSVINQSNVTLTDVTVTDTGLTTLTGGPITLDPGQEDTTTFTGTYIITQADIDAGQYTNQALAEGTAPNGTVVSDDSDDNSYLEDDATVTTICQNITNAIALIKVGTYDGFDVNGNCISAPGDEITYAFSVINQSNVTLTDVTVTDTGLTTLTGGPITLDPGQEDTTTFTGTYIITQADIDAGQYTNQALAEGTAPNGTVVSDDSDDNSYLEDDATVTTICQNITNAIALIKVGTYDGFDVNGNCISAPGDEITYAFSVINQSNVTLTDVTVTDTGLTTLTGGPITLDPGQEDTTTFTGTYIITQADIDAGQYTNQALAEGTAPNGTVVSDDSDDNSYLEDDATVTTICQNITNAIALIKVGTYDGFDVNGNCISAPGDEITYAFSVINQSNVTLTDVTVTDTGLTTLTGGPITLDPGQEDTTTFTGTYIITQADIDAGQYTNQALAEGTAPNGTVVSDDSDDNSYLEDDATVTTICQNITNAIALIKVGTYDGFDQAGNCISAPGDEITYAFSVINQSNVTLTDVTVTDTGLTTLTGGPITLDPGQEDTTTFTGTYIITQADIDAGQYTNQALAEGTAPNGTVVSDDSDDNSYLEDDATVTTICQNITNAIALIKVGTYDGFDVNGNCISAPGDEITYAFSVINQSNVTLTDVTVTDTGLTTLTGGPITLDPGQEDTTTFTGTYIITQADIDAGQYTNQALAEGTAPNGTVVSDDSDDNSYLEDDATVTTICQNITNAIALIKVGTYDGFDVNGNCISAPGDEITYAFSVINQSNVTLTDVTVTDTGLTTLTGGPITLDPGQEDTTTFTGTYIITQADIDAGQYTNQALAEGTAPNGTVVSDDSDDNSYLEDDATVTTICQNITNAIALIKVGTYDGFDQAGNCISAPGDEITYAFSVINQSNVTLTDVTVTDTGLTTLTGGPITLDPGQEDTTTFTGTYIITQADIDAGQYTNQALAEGTAPNGTVVSDDSDDNSYLEDDATVTTICQNITNAIALIKVGTYDGFDVNGNCISAPGDEITYAFSVINQSNVTLTDVTVTDTGLTTLTGGPITLDPGQEDTTTFTGTYIITQADIDAGQYTNQALAEGTAPNGTVVSDDSDDNSYLEDDATVTTICQNITNAIALIKVGTYDGFDVNGNCISTPGDEITYAFSVINQSNVTLTDVTVTDTGLTTLTGGPITLDPGQEDTTTFTGTYIITQADIDAGQYTNQALAEGTAPNGTVVSDDSDDNSYLEDDATVTTICQNITNAIALIKVGTYDGFDVNGNCISTPGDEITYAFSVINQSNVTLTDVTVTDTGLTTLTGGPITLDPGQEDTTTFTGTYIITQADIDAGQYTNQALAEGTAPDGTVVSDDSDDNSYLEDDATVTTICQNITNAIALIKVGTYDGFDVNGNCISTPGDEITYAFSVINQSNVTLTDVTVTDTGLTTLTGGPITLDPGQEDTTTFTGTYIITQADIDAGQYTNQALAEGTAPNGTVVSDDSDDNSYLEDDATVTTICQNITNAIALIKVGTYDGFDVNGNCISTPGDEITYAFSVINQSNVTLTDVTVTDTGLTTLTGGPITLDPGQEDTTTFTGTYIITQADIDAGQYTNQALAEGTAPNGTVVSDDSDDNSYLEDDATVTTICQNTTNAIALIKVGTYDGFDQAGNCISAPGDEITYAFSVINQSNVTLTDVTVTDTGLTTLTGGPITLDPGQEDTTTFTGTYIITQADIDAGQYTNQALAEGTAPNGTVVSDDSDDNSYLEDDATVTTICQNITNAIALIKVGTYDGFDVNGNCISAPGDEITYAFSVINQSNVTLTDVTVTDTGLTTLTGGPITLDPGQEDTTTFTGTYIITQADIDAGQYTNQALAEGTAPNGTVVSDDSDDNSYLEDDATVTTICQNITNAIALIKVGTYDGFDVNGNCISAPGDEITYAFSVINQSNVTLTDVTVTDTGLTTLTGGPITLDPGQEDTTTFTGTYIITQADIDAGQYTNQALAEGTAPNGTVVSDDSDDNSYLEDDPTVTTICQNLNAAIALIKVGTFVDGNGDQCADPGESITYTFSVKNQSNVTLSDVTVTDPLVTVSGGPIVLAPGQEDTTTFTATYIITQDDIDAGQVVNQATVTANSPNGTQVSDMSDDNSYLEDDPTTTTLCQSPAIAIVKTSAYDDGGDCSQPGELIDYTFSVTNEGNVSLSNIVVDDPLLGGPVAGPDSGDTDGDNELDVTETWIYTGSYAITQDDIDNGKVENQATAEGTAPDGTVVTDLSGSTTTTDDGTTTTLCQGGDIAIVKTSIYDDGGDCSQPGELIDYTFSVTNEGNVSLSNIVVDDPLLGGPIPGPDSGDTDGDTLLDITETWIYTASYAITQNDIDNGEVVNQATAEGTTPNGIVVSDLSGSTTTTDDSTTTTLCQSPAIAIVKTSAYDDGGDCSQPGELIDYTFSVTNEGNVSLSNIVVDDPLLGGPVAGPDSGDTDGDNELDVTETWIYTGSYAITQDDIDNGEVVNQATATGTAPDQSTVSDLSGSTTTTDDATTTTLCQSPAIAIVKTSAYDDGGDCSQPGELIDYTFSVTNEGNVSLSNIVVDDPLLGGPVTGPDSGDTDGDNELDVTETWIYTGSYAITQDDIDNGEVVNQATADGTAPDGTVVSDLSGSTTTTDDATTTTLCQGGDIAIVKTSAYDDGGDCSQPGEVIDYTFTVTNEGNVSLSNIVVDDPLLGGPVAGPDSGDTDGDNELDVTETWIYTGSYAITQDDIDNGEVVNQATAEGTAPDGTVATDLSGSTTTTDDATTTTLCQSPAIAIVKTSAYDDGGDCSQPGELIDYTFSVTNEGNVSLSNIVVDDPLLGGPVAGPDSGDTDGDNELDVTETWIYTASYAITQDDIDNGEVVNQATAEGTAPDGTVVTDLSGSTTTTDDATTTTLCQSPAIAIVKTSTYDDGGDCSQPGELIDYTFSVTNEGNVSLSNIVVDDPLLGGPVAGPDSGDTDGDNELDVTETWIYTGSYAITQDDIDNGEVVNQATAEGTAPDGTVVTDLSGSTTTTDDATTTTLCQSPVIAIVKTSAYDDGGDCSQPGELIDYTFTVSNEGNVSLSNIVVDDPLLGGPVAGPDSGDTDGDNELDVTETWIYTGSYAITQDDIDNGEVVNQATAEGTAPNGTVVTDLSGSTTTTDDATTTTLCQEPAIAIVKTSAYDDGGDCSQPGELIDYTFSVTNEGNVSLSNIVVDDPLLGGPVAGPDSGDTDGDNELDVTETWIYTGSYAITQDDIDNGEVVNQATATGTAPDQSTVSDLSGSTTSTDDATVTTLCQSPAIAIVKTSTYDDGGDCSQPGELIDYTFSVTNEGNVSLSNIVVDDPLLGGPVPGPDSGDTDGDNELDVTETWIYTGSYAITQDDIDNGEVVNQATADGTAPDGTVVSDLSGSTTTTDDATVTTLCQEPIIAIVKTSEYDDGGDCSQPGEVIDYTFTVTNEGNVSLSNIVVDDPLLGGPVPGPDSGDTDGDNELDVTEIWIYTGSYTITQDDIDNGEVVNQATAEGTAPNGTVVTDLSGSTTTTDDATVTTLCQDPAIAIVKTSEYDDGGDCSQPGELINYTFVVTNEGNVSLSNIIVDDPLLGGPVAGPDSGDTDGDEELDVTETWIYTASYEITQIDIKVGFVTNQATATGTTPDQSTVSDLSGSTTTTDDVTVTELCQGADIAIVKTSSYDDGGDCSQPGELIDYTFTVTNEGNIALLTIVVRDPLLGGIIPGPDSGDTDGDNQLDVTETWIYTASYAITQNNIDNGEVINQATVTGVTPDQIPVSDLSGSTTTTDDPTVTLLCQSASISLEKSGVFNDDNGDNNCQVGETMSYVFSVTNTGLVTLYNITIEDPLPGIVIEGGPIEMLAPGEVDSTTFTATYAITEQDIDATMVINQAIVTAEDEDGNEVRDDSDDPNDDTDFDNNGDGEPDDPTIVDIPCVLAEEFEIFNGITPNEDGLNDFFEIRGIVDYPDNNVKIYNRWGVLVFETDGYDEGDNVFRGMSNGRATVRQGKELPTGTYFYILTFNGDSPEGRNAYNGYLYINR